MSLAKKFMGMLEEHSKYRTHAVLRRMPEEQLRDMGISPELLSTGVKGWPWQAPSDDDLMPTSLKHMSLAPIKVEDVKKSEDTPANTIGNAERRQTAA